LRNGFVNASGIGNKFYAKDFASEHDKFFFSLDELNLASITMKMAEKPASASVFSPFHTLILTVNVGFLQLVYAASV